jgi:hypothetical protein
LFLKSTGWLFSKNNSFGVSSAFGARNSKVVFTTRIAEKTLN